MYGDLEIYIFLCPPEKVIWSGVSGSTLNLMSWACKGYTSTPQIPILGLDDKTGEKKNPQLDAKRTSETNLKTLDRVRAPSTQNPRATVTHLIHVRSTSFTKQSFGVGSCNFKNGLPIHTTDPTKFSGCHTNHFQGTMATPSKMKIGRIGLDEVFLHGVFLQLWHNHL